MMEAMRILKAINAKPRRTIRIALWEGEEQDYYGSLGYVKTHFGDPATMKLLPEHEKLSAYYNLDNGTGKIRGVFLQGNEAARPIFEAFLKPFAYLGAGTLTILNTGGTDHLVFDAVGLPGFQFIQDPIDYNTRIHHTNLDVMEGVIEDDLKTDAVIIASLAYFTAMRDEKMPRKALPKPHVPANP
jgi:Zn-dependent M28 family amino/carboxypeptidase